MERKEEYTFDYKGELLRKFLKDIKKDGITQRTFAYIIGYTPSWITRWKRGHEEMPDAVAWGIEQFYEKE